jgi:hypothetical protein
MKQPALLLSFLLLVACKATAPEPATLEQPVNTDPEAMESYINEDEGYTLAYPAAWRVEEHVGFPLYNRDSDGTMLVPSYEGFEGSALLNAMVFVERTEGQCPELSPPASEVIEGQTFGKGGNRSEGNGELHDTLLYTLQSPNACHTLTLYMYSCNPLDQCPVENSSAFDPSPVVVGFERIVRSFRLL